MVMDIVKLGCLQEARSMAEVLINNPTPDNFARYRSAVVTICRIFDCEVEEATHKITQLLDNQF